MKYTAIFVILSIALVSCGTDKMSVLLQNQARASDAVDSALDVLRGLKQTNIDAQTFADAVNKTKESEMKAELGDLTDLADTNKANGDAATEHRKYIEERISVTNQYLRWIIARRAELIRKRKALSEQRCASNAAFIIALKQHDEALAVVALLKADVVNIVEQQTGEFYEGLAQITAVTKDASTKLGAYAKLFNDKAIQSFAALTQSNPAQYVDTETAEWDSDATDNKRAQLELDNAAYLNKERDVAHRFIDMINKLEQHLIDSIKDLEANEIQAAVDLSDWLQGTQAELKFLDEEQEANTISIDKLVIAVVAAKAHEDRLWDIYFNSAMTLNDALAQRLVIRARYMAEKARRDEENLVLDGIIQLFIQQVSVLDSRSRASTTDIADDGKFNQSGGNYLDDKVDAMQGSFDSTLSGANKAAARKAY